MTERQFEAIFRRLYVPLGMYALRLVNDIDEAEETVQEAFVRTWELIQSGAEIDNIRTYLYRAVRNNAIENLRRKQQTCCQEEIGDITDEVIDTSERDARIWKAIDQLPERCREIFLMGKRDGLSQGEIANELGLSVQTVKNQMSKALKSLREALEPTHKPFFLPFL